MARTTYVKSARQRYAMVPDLDPTTGLQKFVSVFKCDGVTPKVDKRGRQVTRRLTVQDRTRPLPNLRCDFPGCAVGPVPGEIVVGASYKHITPRSGPYGGTQKNRHAEHPTWNVWEYSYSRSAQVARTQHEMHGAIDAYEFGEADDFDALRDDLAQMASEQRDEQEDALSNMPEQLQDGSQAQEYLEALESWVDEIESADRPDDEYEDCEECEGTGEREDDCDACQGSGEVQQGEDYSKCEECEGTGKVDGECDDCDSGKTDVLSEDWVEAAKDALREVVDGVEI